MAGYASVQDVQALRPQITFGDEGESVPTIDQVQELIDRLSATVDGRLAGSGFVTPVEAGPSPQAYAYLRSAVAYGAAGVVEDQQRAAIGGAGADPLVRQDYYQMYLDAMAAIRVNHGILVDAFRLRTPPPRVEIASFFRNNPLDDRQVGMFGRMRGSALPRFSIRQEF